MSLDLIEMKRDLEMMRDAGMKLVLQKYASNGHFLSPEEFKKAGPSIGRINGGYSRALRQIRKLEKQQ